MRIQYIHLEIDGENIRYDCAPRGRAARIEIDLVGQNIREFSIRGSGDMVLEDLNEERVEISIAGSGSVTSPMPSRMIGLSGDLALKASVRRAISAKRYEASSFR